VAVAQRMYARALFEAAVGAGRVDAVHGELDLIAQALVETPELEAFLSNPQIEPSAKADLLAEVAEGADPLVRNFLRVIAEKGRAGELGQMAVEFDQLVDEAQGRVSVELTTAFELSDDEAAGIIERIQEASGRIVEATRKVDPSLLGGMILQAGSLRVDASVRGRLQRLRYELATGN
jgi:F-type H+-transporting ATPase subunit delta